MRAACRISRFALHLAYGVATVAMVYPFAGGALRVWLKQRWSRQLLSMLGVRLPGRESARQAGGMLVANHISWLDIFVINAVAPSAFVSKDEVKAWPVIGWLSTKADTIFIERGSRRAAHRTAEHLQECLLQGQRVAIFPEGTTSDGSQVLPFHSALIQPAVDAGCAIQPVVLRYRDRNGRPSQAPAYVGDTSLWQSVRAIVMASGLSAEPHFLPPVPAVGTDRRHLAATLHRHISHALVSRD
ncbi:MAG: lysophospholipid acyltransferase family protein [Rhodocyclaceae bacterium]|nr:lysophospholipid acyltransferase family protein [Rhodocyclaceae bacterium]